eukprot:160211_1
MENGKREYSDNHLLFVYDHYIKPYLSHTDSSAAIAHDTDEKTNSYDPEQVDKNTIRNIVIVCHSAAGIATTRLLNERKCILPYIRGVAGTDVDFGRAKNDETKQVFRKYVINYRASYQDIGTVLSDKDEYPLRVSAGHTKHEY